MSETTHDLYEDSLLTREELLKKIRDLSAALVQAEQREAEAMAVLAPNMPESGLVDACRQVKQAAISSADNCEVLEAKLVQAEQRADRQTQLAEMAINNQVQAYRLKDDAEAKLVQAEQENETLKISISNLDRLMAMQRKNHAARLATQEATIREPIRLRCGCTFRKSVTGMPDDGQADAVWCAIHMDKSATIRQVEQEMRSARESSAWRLVPDDPILVAFIRWADTLATLLPAEPKKETDAPKADR